MTNISETKELSGTLKKPTAGQLKYLAAGYTNDPVHGVITGTGNQTSLWFASTGQTATAANVVLNGQYYMGIWRERLVALGFVGI